LIATGDGGKNWHKLATPLSILAASLLDFPTAADGWAVLPSPGRNTTALWRTHDSGTTWAELTYIVYP
jgi:photosystem II stability/assembly factor-like uncharacterized protein